MNLNAIICQEFSTSEAFEAMLEFYNLNIFVARLYMNPTLCTLNLPGIEGVQERVKKLEEDLEIYRNGLKNKPEYSIEIQGPKGKLLLGEETIEEVNVTLDVQDRLSLNPLAFICDEISPLYQPQYLKNLQEALVFEKLLVKIP